MVEYTTETEMKLILMGHNEPLMLFYILLKKPNYYFSEYYFVRRCDGVDHLATGFLFLVFVVFLF